MSEHLAAIEIETASAPRLSVIWLHGLGADGTDFVPIVSELNLPKAPGVRFIFPHAPSMPITCNNGYVMRAWYDIKRFDDFRRHVDEKNIRESAAAIRRLIVRENERGIPSKRIIVAGFSQGGAMAYTVGLTHPDKLAGIIALSAYIPSPPMLEAEFSEVNRTTPIFAAHGSDDPVVPLQLGTLAYESLQQYRCPVEWHTYCMQHGVCTEEIAAIGQWLKARMLEHAGES